MSQLTAEKLEQAVQLVRKSGADAWITFVRETAGGGDPVMPLILDGGLTWQSALIVTADGARVAVVGNYDADPLVSSGDWTEVVPYVQTIREPLIATLEKYLPQGSPRLALNYSLDDVKADGLTYGMFLLFKQYLEGTKFEGALVGAEEITIPLRARKTAVEIQVMRAAIAETDRLFEEIGQFTKVGKTEAEIYRYVQGLIEERGFGYAWDRAGDPIVNSGPDSMLGHGIASDKISLAPGHIFHVDLGIIKDSYSSDLQRCWYVQGEELGVPEDVQAAFRAVTAAIDAAAGAIKPGALGWEVDAAARASLVGHGYEEYLHAAGHQVGRLAHDGGAVLGPRWERYGRTPFIPIAENEVYTLELGVILAGRGYLGLEDMLVVRPHGIEWLSERQGQIWTIS
jgi:Xaa-Pro dipeptidase